MTLPFRPPGGSMLRPQRSCLGNSRAWIPQARPSEEGVAADRYSGGNMVQYLRGRGILLLASASHLFIEGRKGSFCLCLSFPTPLPTAADTRVQGSTVAIGGRWSKGWGTGVFSADHVALWVWSWVHETERAVAEWLNPCPACPIHEMRCYEGWAWCECKVGNN